MSVEARKAERVAQELRELAAEIENAAMGDHAATGWAKRVRRIAKKLDPKK